MVSVSAAPPAGALWEAAASATADAGPSSDGVESAAGALRVEALAQARTQAPFPAPQDAPPSPQILDLDSPEATQVLDVDSDSFPAEAGSATAAAAVGEAADVFAAAVEALAELPDVETAPPPEPTLSATPSAASPTPPAPDVEAAPPPESTLSATPSAAPPPPPVPAQPRALPAPRAFARRDEDNQGAQCLFCMEPFLNQEVCALRCGHVYHGACFQKWLLEGKRSGECPQCKVVSRSDQMRMLNFELGDVEHQSLIDAAKLQKLSEAERAELNVELRAEEAEIEEELQAAKRELEELEASGRESKRLRLEVMQAVAELDATLAAAQEQARVHQVDNAMLSTDLDAKAADQRRRTRMKPPSAFDVQEEKKRLLRVRPAERAKHLHEGLHVLRKQEQDMRSVLLDRRAAAEAEEAEVAILRKQYSQQALGPTSASPTSARAAPPVGASRASAANAAASPRAGSARRPAEAAGTAAALPAVVGAQPAAADAASAAAPAAGGAAAAVASQTAGAAASAAPGPAASATARETPRSAAAGGAFPAVRRGAPAAGRGAGGPDAEDSDLLYAAPARRAMPAAAGGFLARAARPAAPARAAAAPGAGLTAPATQRRTAGAMQSLFIAQRA